LPGSGSGSNAVLLITLIKINFNDYFALQKNKHLPSLQHEKHDDFFTSLMHCNINFIYARCALSS
jgi:hypothetical protein